VDGRVGAQNVSQPNPRRVRITERKVSIVEDDAKRLEELTRPLIQWLNETYHPHVAVIVTPVGVELFESYCSVPITDYVPD
jgi:hypothetical protein